MKKWVGAGICLVFAVIAACFFSMKLLSQNQLPEDGDVFTLGDGSTVTFFNAEQEVMPPDTQEDYLFNATCVTSRDMLVVAEVMDTRCFVIRDGYETEIEKLKRKDEQGSVSLLRIRDVLTYADPADRYYLPVKEDDCLVVYTDLHNTEGKARYRTGQMYVMGITNIRQYDVSASWEMQLGERMQLDCYDTLTHFPPMLVENGRVDASPLYKSLRIYDNKNKEDKFPLRDKPVPETIDGIKEELNALGKEINGHQ